MEKTMNTDGKPLEIERKYLIEYPEMPWLMAQEGLQMVQITQYYIETKDDGRIRIRFWKEGENTRYILTKKTRISDLTRIEEEQDISAKEFEHFLSAAPEDRRQISKTRYRFPFDNKTIEVDIFPFWKDQAIAEVELSSEEEVVHLPEGLHVIREVSSDRDYTSYSLAKAFS